MAVRTGSGKTPSSRGIFRTRTPDFLGRLAIEEVRRRTVGYAVARDRHGCAGSRPPALSRRHHTAFEGIRVPDRGRGRGRDRRPRAQGSSRLCSGSLPSTSSSSRPTGLSPSRAVRTSSSSSSSSDCRSSSRPSWRMPPSARSRRKRARERSGHCKTSVRNWSPRCPDRRRTSPFSLDSCGCSTIPRAPSSYRTRRHESCASKPR